MFLNLNLLIQAIFQEFVIYLAIPVELRRFFDFYNNHIAGSLYSQDRQRTIELLKTKMSILESPHKYCIYSNIGMQILGCVIEAIIKVN